MKTKVLHECAEEARYATQMMMARNRFAQPNQLQRKRTQHHSFWWRGLQEKPGWLRCGGSSGGQYISPRPRCPKQEALGQTKISWSWPASAPRPHAVAPVRKTLSS